MRIKLIYYRPSQNLYENGTIIDVDTELEDLGFELYTDNEFVHIAWMGT